jgi:hypothetical protein
VKLGPLTPTPLDKYTFATRTAVGWSAGERVPAFSTRQRFKWRFDLGPNQRLVPLPNGGLVTSRVDMPIQPGGPAALTLSSVEMDVSAIGTDWSWC